jgi:serine/threonine protein kinase
MDVAVGRVVAGQQGSYEITDANPIGSGASAAVYRAVSKSDGRVVAVKAIDRYEIEGNGPKIKQLVRELNIARKLKHPNVIELLDVAFEREFVMLIMEIADGGMLFDLVASGTPLSEAAAAPFVKQLVAAVEYCHTQQIYHRDLKLENVVLSSKAEQHVKVADFGMSKDASVNSMPKTRVGTVSYMAPEVTNAAKSGSDSLGYADGADIWSLGVILYVLVCCKYPFGFEGTRRNGGLKPLEVLENIRTANCEYPESMSPELVELLKGIFTVEPAARWNITQISGCEWLSKIGLPAAAGGLQETLMPEIEWPLESLQSSGSGLGFDEGFDEGLDEGLGFDGEPEMMTAPDTLQLGGGRRSQYQDDALDDDLGGGGLGLELDDSLGDDLALEL